jgi:ABC-2 type transport system permease protein
MLGISLMFAGLALIHKRVQSFVNIIQYFLIAFVLPANGFFGEMGKTLIPFRPSIEKFYEITLGNKSLLDFPITDYLLIVVNSAVYFCLGLLVFNICSKKAKKKGLLGQY